MLRWCMQKLIPNDILIGEIDILLREGKDVELMAKGSSMNPFIRGGRDSVILRRMADDELAPGDIVLAEYRKGCYVLHRVLEVRGENVLLMGDGNVAGREQCHRQDIIGKAIAVVKPSGKVVKPGRAAFWRRLGPVPRRYLLAFYRRIIIKIFK